MEQDQQNLDAAEKELTDIKRDLEEVKARTKYEDEETIEQKKQK
jgi:hypothetical protein